MDTNTSRRALIGGAGLAAIIAAAPVLASSTGRTAADPQWERLVAAFNRADAKMIAIGKEHDVKSLAYQAGRQILGDKPARPEIEYPRAIVDMTVGELRDGKFSVPVTQQRQYEADLAAWTAEEAALDQRTMGDVDERWEAAVDEQDAASHVIIAYPAPTSSELLYKLALIERQYKGCDLDAAVMAHCFTDVRRLLNGEAQ